MDVPKVGEAVAEDGNKAGIDVLGNPGVGQYHHPHGAGIHDGVQFFFHAPTQGEDHRQGHQAEQQKGDDQPEANHGFAVIVPEGLGTMDEHRLLGQGGVLAVIVLPVPVTMVGAHDDDAVGR